MGKTCSGKNAVVSELVKRGWSQIVTYTTRPRRRGEIEGREYHFLTDEEFESISQDNTALKKMLSSITFTTSQNLKKNNS